MSSVIDQVEALASYFAEASTVDPVSAVLLLVGTTLIVVSSAVIGVLTIGAVGELFRRLVI